MKINIQITVEQYMSSLYVMNVPAIAEEVKGRTGHIDSDRRTHGECEN